jgi:hypothetical protein
MEFQALCTVGPAVIFESKKKLIPQHILAVYAQYWTLNAQESWKFKIFYGVKGSLGGMATDWRSPKSRKPWYFYIDICAS